MGASGSGPGGLVALFEGGATAGRGDAELLAGFLGGDPAEADRAFAALMARHGPLVLGVARQVLRDDHAAQDACQATFLVLARRAGSIRRPEALASWLFGVARRVAHRARLDRDRRVARERRAAVPDAGRTDPPTFEADDRLALIEEVGRLPERYRSAVVLCDLEGLTYEAAARQLGCPLGTLSVRLRRARERLRARLARRGVSPVPSFPLVDLTAPWIRLASIPSPFVAALAARSLLMMRLRSLASLALGLSALGTLGVGLSLVALADPQERPPRPAPAPVAVDPSRPTPPLAPWVRNLPGGIVVELARVNSYALKEGATELGKEYEIGRWRPDGSSDAINLPPDQYPPFCPVYAQQKSRGFTVRVDAPADHELTFQWEVEPRVETQMSHQDNFRTKASDAPRSTWSTILAAFPADARTATVRFAVAAGPWRTAVAGGGGGRSIADGNGCRALFARPVAAGGHTSLAVAHDQLPGEVRVVAVDRRGVVHQPIGVSGRNGSMSWGRGGTSDYQSWHQGDGTPGEGLRDSPPNLPWDSTAADRIQGWELTFTPPPAEIAEFRVQNRPFEWTTFADVPLERTPKP